MSALAGFWTPLVLAGFIGLLAGLTLAWRTWARSPGTELDPLCPHPEWGLPWLSSGLGREAWVVPDKAARRMLAEALAEHLSERAQVLLVPDPETPWTGTDAVRMASEIGAGGKHLLAGVRVLQNFGEVVLLLEGTEGLAQDGAVALPDWMQKVRSPTVALLMEGEDLPGGSVRILNLSRTESGLVLGDGSEVLRQVSGRGQLVTSGRN